MYFQAMYAFHISLILSMIVAITNGDYECLCNYAVQHNILSETDPIAAVIGELFEFDCKPTYRLGPNIPNWLAIQFNNKVIPYVHTSLVPGRSE